MSKYDALNKMLDSIVRNIGSHGEGCDFCKNWQPPAYSYEVAVASLAAKPPTCAEWERQMATSTAQLPSYEALLETLRGRCGKCGRRLPGAIVVVPYDAYAGWGVVLEEAEILLGLEDAKQNLTDLMDLADDLDGDLDGETDGLTND